MSEPRFLVRSVSGYSGEGGNNARPATTYVVLDRPFCYELVFETKVKRTAERIAAAMNAGDLAAAARQQQIRETQRRRRAMYRR